jgi:DNA-binding NarL/FixJ family response regulator
VVDGDPGSGGSEEAGGEDSQAPSSTASSSGDDAAAIERPPHPRQSPVYHALHADRYHRQELIRAYEQATGAKFVAALDYIDIDFVLNLEEHLINEKGDRELHLMLRSPGGDGEQAIRAIRVLQSRCSRLVLVIPDMAKSAATLLALGADEIRLGPASDLGPIDPQMMIGGRWFAAKAVLAAVEQAEDSVKAERALTPLWASLLAEVTALDVQSAKAELERTTPMIRQALSYRTQPPNEAQTEDLVRALVAALQEEPTSHGASLGPTELQRLQLPVVQMDPNSWEWQCIWRLWTLYWVQIRAPIYESLSASYRPEGPHPA